MDDVEFLERTVKNNKDFVAGQIASIKKDMKNQISTLEKKTQRDGGKKPQNCQHEQILEESDFHCGKQTERDEGKKPQTYQRNSSANKDCLQAGITGLEDPSPNSETARAPELVDPKSSNPEPPRAKRRKQIE